MSKILVAIQTMDLYVYKLNESTGNWEQQAVTENWVVSTLLAGRSKDKDFSLTEGKWMFVMAGGEGVQALTGYSLNFTKDIVLDYGNAESIEGSAEGNMITDEDPKFGKDEVPEGTVLTAINGEAISLEGQTIINGQYGQLVVVADGSYTYTINDDFRGYGEKDIFTYEVTSPSGEKAQSDLVFELNLSFREDRIEIDNTVIVNTEPVKVHDGISEIASVTSISVLDLSLLDPIVSADLIGTEGVMTFTVDENQVKELNFQGEGGSALSLATSFDLIIYRLDPVTE